MKNLFLTLLLTAMMCVPFTASAQVTIGSDRAPSPWSLLDLDNSERVENREQPKALHLPRLTDDDRENLNLEATAGAESPARGLMIFNIDSECLEFWSGTAWISLCEGDEPPFITPPHFNPACRENPAYAECFATLRRFNSTVRQLNDGTPRNFAHPTISAINFNMMPVTGGVFYMGASTNPAHPNFDPNSWNPPVHQVGVSSFYMSQTLVTRDLFYAVMSFSGATVSGTVLLNAWNTANTPNSPTNIAAIGVPAGEFAQNMVSWYDAVLFANRLSLILGRDAVYTTTGNAVFHSVLPALGTVRQDISVNGFRLPTEAEWEYAARGGQRNEYTRTLGADGTVRYHFRWSGTDDDPPVNHAWYSGHPVTTFGSEVRPVGRLAPNQLGLYDMSGNLWEWTWNWWIRFTCCSINPEGPNDPDEINARVYRGGSWNMNADNARVSSRGSSSPWVRLSRLGIRLVSNAGE